MIDLNEANPDWGASFETLRLPTDEDIAAAGKALAAMSQGGSLERAVELRRLGLLGGMEELLCANGQAGSAIRNRKIEDLAELVEKFETLSSAIDSPQCQADSQPPLRELRLRECRIERADMSSVDVHLPLNLEHCSFPRPVQFVGTQFHRTARFIGASFYGQANFFAATFGDQAIFGGARFYGPADFRGATFSQEVSFFRANFTESLELKFAKFEPGARLNVLELRFRGSSVLGGGLALGSEQLRRGGWPRWRGLIAGEDSRDSRSLADACEQYGELEANFAAQGSPDSSASQDWCHYRYMDLRRRTTRGRGSPLRMLDWLFLKWGFGYGVYTRRILLSGLAVIFLFGLLFATNCLGLGEPAWSVQYGDTTQTLSSGPWWERLGNSLYFSVITFATVGYGDWHPIHWARMAAAIEGLTGVFVMSLFTVSFARKIIR